MRKQTTRKTVRHSSTSRSKAECSTTADKTRVGILFHGGVPSIPSRVNVYGTRREFCILYSIPLSRRNSTPFELGHGAPNRAEYSAIVAVWRTTSEGRGSPTGVTLLPSDFAPRAVIRYYVSIVEGQEVAVGAWLRIALAGIVLTLVCSGLLAQTGDRRFQTPQASTSSQAASDQPDRTPDPHAEEELQKGTALTRAGSFAEAIPHLRAALGRVSNEYAASFNLSLSLVATGQPKVAIPILTALRENGHDNVDVNNLLAQAYVGDGQTQKALEALQDASRLAPENEKLYLFVADACLANHEYGVGL